MLGILENAWDNLKNGKENVPPEAMVLALSERKTRVGLCLPREWLRAFKLRNFVLQEGFPLSSWHACLDPCRMWKMRPFAGEEDKHDGSEVSTV
jgi:hypothetical protein